MGKYAKLRPGASLEKESCGVAGTITGQRPARVAADPQALIPANREWGIEH